MDIFRTVDPIMLRSVYLHVDPDGLFSLTSQWGGGRTLWAKRVEPVASYSIDSVDIEVADRVMLSNLKLPLDTPMQVRRKSSGTAVYWVAWDRVALLNALYPHPPRRGSAPL